MHTLPSEEPRGRPPPGEMSVGEGDAILHTYLYVHVRCEEVLYNVCSLHFDCRAHFLPCLPSATLSTMTVSLSCSPLHPTSAISVPA